MQVGPIERLGEADRVSHRKVVLDIFYCILVCTAGEGHDGYVGPILAENVQLCILGAQIRNARFGWSAEAMVDFGPTEARKSLPQLPMTCASSITNLASCFSSYS